MRDSDFEFIFGCVVIGVATIVTLALAAIAGAAGFAAVHFLVKFW